MHLCRARRSRQAWRSYESSPKVSARKSCPRVLSTNVRTPEMIAWWSPAARRPMFFGAADDEARKLNGGIFLILRSCSRCVVVNSSFVRSRETRAREHHAADHRTVLECRTGREGVPWDGPGA